MTDEELDELAKHLPFVKAWLKAVEEELERRIDSGVEFDSVTKTSKQTRRLWTLEGEDLMTFLLQFGDLDTVAPRVPLSVPEMEKVTRDKDVLKAHVQKIASVPSLTYVK